MTLCCSDTTQGKLQKKKYNTSFFLSLEKRPGLKQCLHASVAVVLKQQMRSVFLFLNVRRKKMWRCAVACRGILITAGLITQSRKDLRKRCPIMLQPSQLAKRTYNNAGIFSFFLLLIFLVEFHGTLPCLQQTLWHVILPFLNEFTKLAGYPKHSE